MKKFSRAITVLALLFAGVCASAQSKGFDVFIPISKYISQGNADAVSVWFADNLEIGILDKGVNSSRSQACQILRSFFATYTPRSFNIVHTASRANMKYVLGELKAGGETFHVTIFASCTDDNYRIQQFTVERAE